jgi:hypothetical protein
MRNASGLGKPAEPPGLLPIPQLRQRMIDSQTEILYPILSGISTFSFFAKAAIRPFIAGRLRPAMLLSLPTPGKPSSKPVQMRTTPRF